MYNEHHRKGKPSQYTWENVAIVPGGRAGLIRIAAVLNQAYLGFFIPDYTAYNEMLSLFRNVSLDKQIPMAGGGYEANLTSTPPPHIPSSPQFQCKYSSYITPFSHGSPKIVPC